MENPTPGQSAPPQQRLKLLYWVAAAAMVVATVLEVTDGTPDPLKIGSRVALVLALILLGTARSVETRGKKILIYLLVAVALGLLLARLARG